MLFTFPPGITICPQEEAIGHSRHNWEEGDDEEEKKPELLSLVALVSSPRSLDLWIFLRCNTSSFHCVVFPGKYTLLFIGTKLSGLVPDGGERV